MGKAIEVKRSQLYELVWSKPVKTVAMELGISDVGLAKACRRSDIPVPPRGYWAKVEAGRESPQVRLPKPDEDHVVQMVLKDPVKVARRKEEEKKQALEFEERTKQLQAPALVVMGTLDRPHPLVKSTLAYCARLPNIIARYNRVPVMERFARDIERPAPVEKGRLCLSDGGGLVIAVSQAHLDWVLRFHDVLFKAMTQAGAKLVREESKDRLGPRVVAQLAGESLSLFFKEGYRRAEIDADELLKIRAKNQYANQWMHEGSGKFTLKVTGTEWKASKEWVGTAAQLEQMLPGILTVCLDFLHQMPVMRDERKKLEETQRLEREREFHEREVRDARAKQLEKAFALVDENKRVEALRVFLDRLEADAANFMEPYAERARVWIEVVRAELARADPYEKLLVECLSPDPWREWPPQWWPEEKKVPSGANSRIPHVRDLPP
jgi:hypothetical protein